MTRLVFNPHTAYSYSELGGTVSFDKNISDFKTKIIVYKLRTPRSRINESRIPGPEVKKHWFPDLDPQHWSEVKKCN
jgi:hypothetical protein